MGSASVSALGQTMLRDEPRDLDLIRTFQGPDRDVVEGPSGCAGGQIQGKREEQQDSYGWVMEPGVRNAGEQLVLLVADGMGGHAGGATASRVVVESFGAAFGQSRGAISERLEDGLRDANWNVAGIARKNSSLGGMGATLVAAHISGQRFLRWISVGDSPMWRFSKGSLLRLNRDHSMTPLLAQLVQLGHLTAEEAATDTRHHRLRSVVMGGDIPLIDLQDDAIELDAGDVLILASDGLETLNENEVATIAKAHGTSSKALVEALLTAVRGKSMPYQDNATVVVYTKPARD